MRYDGRDSELFDFLTIPIQFRLHRCPAAWRREYLAPLEIEPRVGQSLGGSMAEDPQLEETQRWTARRRAALVISPRKGEATAAEAAAARVEASRGGSMARALPARGRERAARAAQGR